MLCLVGGFARASCSFRLFRGSGACLIQGERTLTVLKVKEPNTRVVERFEGFRRVGEVWRDEGDHRFMTWPGKTLLELSDVEVVVPICLTQRDGRELLLLQGWEQGWELLLAPSLTFQQWVRHQSIQQGLLEDLLQGLLCLLRR